MSGDIHTEGAHFKVMCKRCEKVFEVIRNFGGGIRSVDGKTNPMVCPTCGSRQLEVY